MRRPRWTGCNIIPGICFRRIGAALRSGADLWRRQTGCESLHRRRARRNAFPSTMRSIHTRIIQLPAIHVLKPISDFLATDCLTAKHGWRNFFCGWRPACRKKHFCSAAMVGRTSPIQELRYVGHVYTRDHNAFNCTPQAVLNVNRESMARYGFSPPTRVFEAAGCGACLITDAMGGNRIVSGTGSRGPGGAGWRGSREHLPA